MFAAVRQINRTVGMRMFIESTLKIDGSRREKAAEMQACARAGHTTSGRGFSSDQQRAVPQEERDGRG